MQVERALALAGARCGFNSVRIENEEKLTIEIRSGFGDWFREWDAPEICRRFLPPGVLQWPGPRINWSKSSGKELALAETLEREFRRLTLDA